MKIAANVQLQHGMVERQDMMPEDGWLCDKLSPPMTGDNLPR